MSEEVRALNELRRDVGDLVVALEGVGRELEALVSPSSVPERCACWGRILRKAPSTTRERNGTSPNPDLG